ncbi:pullulanase [Klebsormidium nitens]|uniref:Pullulanase n=1 Tax=Klebsormidium nitens TaxID=105231 RepID=A0A1Y1I819_KLENI|nr:pullulanase [Klebsormidium nitens]|eukprot:GAQ85291.1 pullulanase [Klebsormidium nitens]
MASAQVQICTQSAFYNISCCKTPTRSQTLPACPLPVFPRSPSRVVARQFLEKSAFSGLQLAQSRGKVPLVRPRVVQVRSSAEVVEAKAPAVTTKTIKVHYYRKDQQYQGWGLHLWGEATTETPWHAPLEPAGEDGFGVFWEVELLEQGGTAEFLVHRGDEKDAGGALSGFSGPEVWLVSGKPNLYIEQPDPANMPQGDLSSAKALWLSKDVIAWSVDPADANGSPIEYFLHACKDAELEINADGIQGGIEPIKLEVDSAGLPSEALAKFPYTKGLTALRVPEGVDVRTLVKGQVAVSASAGGRPLDATSVQLPGVLDDLFAYDGPLGLHFAADTVSLAVWAPTAKSVRLVLYKEPKGDEALSTVPMEDNESGVWSVTGPRKDWEGLYFHYEVTVFCPWTNRIETSLSTDPYSRSLSANGERSQIADVTSDALKPSGWGSLASEKPPLTAFKDISIYELHVRDFSASDETVGPAVRGGYLAFAEEGTAGTAHLKSLADAGLTHLHLLPSYDFGSVNEDKDTWQSPGDLAGYAPDGEEQQAAVTAIQNADGFNWGYDPVHYGVPDGSYASDPDGTARILEFRKMVQGINRLGLRVVLDVVYNHVFSTGPESVQSNFDKIVPGYYVRRNLDGQIENSTCMNNTASEHYMFGRFIVDDLLHWATQYKVDGFRFDLMGHIMKDTMLRARDALRSLTAEKDGVDGANIYLYGEGWNFGEVAGNSRGVNAAQLNLAGTGIGSFNDRIRDGIMGGSPFGDIQAQGYLTGLYLRPNELDQGSADGQREGLQSQTDWIKVGLVGNLASYSFTSYTGEEKRGDQVFGNGGDPVGYTASPDEVINYASAHDNETLFDIIMLKVARGVTLDERLRLNHLATSIIALSQGIPFFHAGDDTLRSKSLDRDSYNSGDWFNRLDWSYESNNFGVGLPPREKNGEKWDIMRPLLADPSLKPTKEHILAARSNLRNLLAVRYSSPLFRLGSAAAIQERVTFYDCGPSATPGVIVMGINGGDSEPVCDNFKHALLVFNASADAYEKQIEGLQGHAFRLHPTQAESNDPVLESASWNSDSGTFVVPKYSWAVYVERR